MRLAMVSMKSETRGKHDRFSVAMRREGDEPSDGVWLVRERVDQALSDDHPAGEMRADPDNPRADGAMGRPAESVVDQSMKSRRKSSASRQQAR